MPAHLAKKQANTLATYPAAYPPAPQLANDDEDDEDDEDDADEKDDKDDEDDDDAEDKPNSIIH